MFTVRDFAPYSGQDLQAACSTICAHHVLDEHAREQNHVQHVCAESCFTRTRQGAEPSRATQLVMPAVLADPSSCASHNALAEDHTVTTLRTLASICKSVQQHPKSLHSSMHWHAHHCSCGCHQHRARKTSSTSLLPLLTTQILSNLEHEWEHAGVSDINIQNSVYRTLAS
jgi:hypothetical protein